MLIRSWLYRHAFAHVGPAGAQLPLGSGARAVMQDRDAAAWEATNRRTLAWLGDDTLPG